MQGNADIGFQLPKLGSLAELCAELHEEINSMTSTVTRFQSCVGFSLAAAAMVSIPTISLAVSVEEVPNPRQVDQGWVSDMADILSPATEATLNQKISELEAKNGSEIAVVTVPDTSPSETPKEFATTLFNYWGIGKAAHNNGVLFLISQGDRRVEIETGYGIEPHLPNDQVAQIIDQQIIPQFKQGNFDGGTLAGIQAVVQDLEPVNYTASSADVVHSSSIKTVDSSSPSTETSSSQAEVLSSWSGLSSSAVWGAGLLIVFLFLLMRNHDDDDSDGGKKHKKRQGWFSSSSSGYVGGYGGSGGCGGSGGGFGGGSSGGGGAGGGF